MLRGQRLPKKPSRREDDDEEPGRARAAPGLTPPSKPVFRGLRQDEVDDMFEQNQSEGRCFRRGMFMVFFLFFALLLFLKWDKEFIAPPDDEMQKVITSENGEEDLTDKYYSMLNVKKDDPTRRQKMEEQYQAMQDKLDPEKNPDCGADCATQLAQIKDAYNALSTIPTNPFHKVLKVPRAAGFQKIKRAYAKAKEEAERGESKYDLAEIKEAFDILSSPDSRAYYNLYGAKPPAVFKNQQKTTHGGWGVEIGMGTFKYAIMKAWLEYFNNGWVDLGFFGIIFLVMGVKVWNNRHELMEKMEQMEAMEKMCAEE